jgi:hypothetical protein
VKDLSKSQVRRGDFSADARGMMAAWKIKRGLSSSAARNGQNNESHYGNPVIESIAGPQVGALGLV